MQTLYHSDFSSSNFLQQLIVADFAGKQIPQQPIPTKTTPLCLVDQTLILEEPNSISYHIATGSKLVGVDIE